MHPRTKGQNWGWQSTAYCLSKMRRVFHAPNRQWLKGFFRKMNTETSLNNVTPQEESGGSGPTTR